MPDSLSQWRSRLATPVALFVVTVALVGLVVVALVGGAAAGEAISWGRPWVARLIPALVPAGILVFGRWRYRAPALRYSRVAELIEQRSGHIARLAVLPDVLRLVGLALILLALARPQTFATKSIHVEGIDVMIVLDLSKSMEEQDMRKNRLDAGQRTIRRFIRSRKTDRLGLVVFAEGAMLRCPLTLDYPALDTIVADLAIGEVPAMGTALGDALGLSLASLRRSDARSKVVILLSDGDSNTTTNFAPLRAKDLAVELGVRVFTILLGREAPGSGASPYSVNPELLRSIASDTGGGFFRAGNDRELASHFERVASLLEKSRRRVVGRIPDAELFVFFLIPAIILLVAEWIMRLTRWRRFP